MAARGTATTKRRSQTSSVPGSSRTGAERAGMFGPIQQSGAQPCHPLSPERIGRTADAGGDAAEQPLEQLGFDMANRRPIERGKPGGVQADRRSQQSVERLLPLDAPPAMAAQLRCQLIDLRIT